MLTHPHQNIILVGGSICIPKVQPLLGEYVNKEPLGGIKPTRCAAVHHGILAGQEGLDDIADVCPLSVGAEPSFHRAYPSQHDHPHAEGAKTTTPLAGSSSLVSQLCYMGVPQTEANGLLKVSADKGIGESELIAFADEKARLLLEGVNRVVCEAEFATEDQRKRIESLNSLHGVSGASSHKFPMPRVSVACNCGPMLRHAHRILRQILACRSGRASDDG